MIQAVTTLEQQAQYRRRISGKPYFEAVLGTHLALFGAHPASGWMFYLLPGTAVLELRGGSGAQIGHAVAMALKNLLGLVCDPVAGLVEVPCVKRNVIGAVNAVSAADMALAGIESRIPVDEVIDAMGEVGRRLPVELKETALGGLAATPTGERVKRDLQGGAQAAY